MIDDCRSEVDRLHRFIAQWLQGALEKSEAAYSPFVDALDESFVLLHPDGTRSDKPAIAAAFFAAHGRGGPELRVRIRHREARPLAPELALVVYEEWHLGPVTNGRLSSAVLRSGGDGRPRWLHLHDSKLAEATPPA